MRDLIASSLAALVLGAATLSAAQTPSWAPAPNPPRGMTAAVAEWPSGISMVARCAGAHGFDMVLTLAQPINQPHVAVDMTSGEEDSSERWVLSEDGAFVFARFPARLARALIQEGAPVFVVTPDGGPRQRFELAAPERPEVLAGVMQACDVELDAAPEPTAVPTWVQRPTGEHLAAHYPEDAMHRGMGGEATIECIVRPDGRLGQCIVESESPEEAGFGEATLALARYFRMAREGGFPNEVRVRIPIRWQIGGAWSGL